MAERPVTPQELFDLWQKIVNPGAYPLQSLMFPVLDPKDIEKRIAELETVEHWLKANLNLLQLSIKSLEYQLALVKGGERAAGTAGTETAQNPAMWAWNMMAQAGKSAAQAAQAAMSTPASPQDPGPVSGDARGAGAKRPRKRRK